MFAYIWFLILIGQNGGMSSPSKLEYTLDFILVPVTIAIYIFICVKIVCSDNKKSHMSDKSLERAAKLTASAARITVIVLMVGTVVYLAFYLYVRFNGL